MSSFAHFTSDLTAELHGIARDLVNQSTKPKTEEHYRQDGTQHEQFQGSSQFQQGGSSYGTDNRFGSYAKVRDGNVAKWYVDGKDYMWAVSRALESAKKSIFILDWWLSPELYLRRPPSRHEEYRLDRMLKTAAERGVKVHIVVYKEVTQALTLSSHHTKSYLESLHPNIAVFRHPDHTPDPKVFGSSVLSGLKNYHFGDGIKGLYGLKDDVVLYWAHHEKLCLIDAGLPGEVAFMGGLDLCFGRWDTNQHEIADAHPGDVSLTVFPGQDYNNARIMDFHNVDQWDQNQLNRVQSSRMGWSDIAISVLGPSANDLYQHFAERWNYIFREKYDHKDFADRYQALDLEGNDEAGTGGFHRMHRHFEERRRRFRQKAKDMFGGGHPYERDEDDDTGEGVRCQILRSSADWSHGIKTEHSVCNAYIEIILNAKYFIYIENQFFITATCDKQLPVHNMIGAAIVERILQAARNGDKFRIIVIMPAVPAFAGDLKDDSSLGTRAIMEFQYNSICRGGNSIMEQIAKAGFNPRDYIRFFNLRNYDRINSGPLDQAQRQTGIDYESARKAHDQQVGGARESDGHVRGDEYQRYNAMVHDLGGAEWDSVAKCYMQGGPDIREAPWNGTPQDELDAFVSEELYIHSKVLIADDKIVICGSANLNDRSQLGDHDSEIAIVIEDSTPLNSIMDGNEYIASNFAGTLRRQIFRKHLGMIPAQDLTIEDENMHPVPAPNLYDFSSSEDRWVTDPLSDDFWNLWNQTAKQNTEIFSLLFHPVPNDSVQNWKQYNEFYSTHFKAPEGDEKGQPKVKWGHIVKSNFPEGAEGVRQVKESLSRIRGNLVEMSLEFLREEDIAKEGIGSSYNTFTATVYT